MSKTVLSNIDGFTPVPDVLEKRYGLMTAVVFGLIWRYCQMKDGACRAGLERIAREFNIGRMSAIRHIRILVSAGFLQDTTPDLRNQPHIYADTGKLALEGRLRKIERDARENNSPTRVRVTESDSPMRGGVTESDSTVTSSDSQTLAGVTDSDSTVTMSDSHSTTESLEDSIKIQVKKQATTTTTTTSNDENFKTLEQDIGSPTPIISQETGPPTLIISQDL